MKGHVRPAIVKYIYLDQHSVHLCLDLSRNWPGNRQSPSWMIHGETWIIIQRWIHTYLKVSRWKLFRLKPIKATVHTAKQPHYSPRLIFWATEFNKGCSYCATEIPPARVNHSIKSPPTAGKLLPPPPQRPSTANTASNNENKLQKQLIIFPL